MAENLHLLTQASELSTCLHSPTSILIVTLLKWEPLHFLHDDYSTTTQITLIIRILTQITLKYFHKKLFNCSLKKKNYLSIYLSSYKQFITWYNSFIDLINNSLSHFIFIFIHRCSINVSVAYLYATFNCSLEVAYIPFSLKIYKEGKNIIFILNVFSLKLTITYKRSLSVKWWH